MNPINFNEYKERIITALESRNFRMRQAGTQSPEYILIDGFVNQPIYNQLSNSVVIGGPSVPMIMVAHIQTGELHFFPLKALVEVTL